MTRLEFDDKRFRRYVLEASHLETVFMDWFIGKSPCVFAYYKKRKRNKNVWLSLYKTCITLPKRFVAEQERSFDQCRHEFQTRMVAYHKKDMKKNILTSRLTKLILGNWFGFRRLVQIVRDQRLQGSSIFEDCCALRRVRWWWVCSWE